MMNTNALRKQAAKVIAVLTEQRIQNWIIGGVLRVEALGGKTNDIDIAVLCTPQEYEDVEEYIIRKFGVQPAHRCASVYANATGFFADFRIGDVNIIIYNQQAYPHIEALVNSFDLNINKYYEVFGAVTNEHFNGIDVEYTGHCLHIPQPERVQRFRTEYPHLNWSNVNV